ncbi:MAG: methionine--tRNA ligase [Candidatus Gracilibacteria bacterium]|jgi:methionyl-tRNA synthetase
MSKFYITNAIPYVNAAPHMGHALELCEGDALARYHEMIGDDVYFLVGTDEHGSKIQQVAKDKGVAPAEFVEGISATFIEMTRAFGARNNNFLRTTSDLHKRGAQKFWEMLEKAGDLYEKEYEGNYCTGCETFVLDKDAEKSTEDGAGSDASYGLCPIHKKPLTHLKEKNLFFRLSKYSDQIREKVLSGELTILPESRRNEFLSVLKDGLQDVSFSRPLKTLSWGIPVPGKPDQVMYVWCDALTNYLTALGFADDDPLWRELWPADVHLIGKDIIRFHCGIWIGMLISAGLPLPKAIYVHGFITHNGQKMSKSLGNTVDPMEILVKFGVDSVRYYLLREIPSDDDGDYSEERFRALYQDELQHTIGNLVRRVMTLAIKNFEGARPKSNGLIDGVDVEIKKAWDTYHAEFKAFRIKEALEAMVSLARFANLYVDTKKPWEMVKTDKEQAEIVLGNLVLICKALGEMLKPIIPVTSEKILSQIGEDKLTLGEVLFPALVESLEK